MVLSRSTIKKTIKVCAIVLISLLARRQNPLGYTIPRTDHFY